ncbi:MAG TPA: ABC transporter permease [Spirochaetia bacterium]|nr:ABC transporter permease [Spirochaetia bacterium]
MKGMRARLYRVAPWLGFLSLLAGWEIIAALKLVQPAIFPGPLLVVQSVLQTLSVGSVLGDIGISLGRVLSGFLVGTAAGVVFGVVSGWYPRLGTALRTPIELLRPVPPLAWIPLAIIWLGVGETSKVFVIALGVFFPVFTNTYKGMLTINPNVIRAAQTLGLRSARLLLKVVVPMTLPDIATGMRLGWSYGFGTMVAAELIAANSGLGYLIMHGRELGLIGIIVFGIVLIGAINLITDFLLQELVFKKLLHWHFLTTSA